MQAHSDYYAPQMEALASSKKDGGAQEMEGDAAAASRTGVAADAPAGAGDGPSPAAVAAIDWENVTDKDIEGYLDRLDKEE